MFKVIPRTKTWRLFGLEVWRYEYDKVVWLPVEKKVVSGLPPNQALNDLSDNVQTRRAEAKEGKIEDKHTQSVNRLSDQETIEDKDD